MAPWHGSHSPAGLLGQGSMRDPKNGTPQFKSKAFSSNSTNRLLMVLRGMLGRPSPRRNHPALLTVELAGRAQPGSREGTGQSKRLWVLLIARKDQPLKSPEPFNLYSDSSLLIPTFWVQLWISRSPRTASRRSLLLSPFWETSGLKPVLSCPKIRL